VIEQSEELSARLAATKMSFALRRSNEAALATIKAEAAFSAHAAGFGGSDLPDELPLEWSVESLSQK